MKLRYLFVVFGFAAAFAFSTLSHADDANKLPPEDIKSAPTGKAEPPPSQAEFDEGKQLFQNRCARCHGWNMVNLGSIAYDLRQFPRDDRVRFFHSVTYGLRAMPVWKDILTQAEIGKIWAYVRSGGKL